MATRLEQLKKANAALESILAAARQNSLSGQPPTTTFSPLEKPKPAPTPPIKPGYTHPRPGARPGER